MAEGGKNEGDLDYTVRRMQCKEIPKVLEVWTETGLVEGTHSLETWYGVDPHGFYVAVDKKGDFLGICAGINLRADLAFVGLYAVRSPYRGKGVGKKVWKAAMDHVGDRNVGLNSVPEHLHTYRDLAGFGIVADWRLVIYEGQDLTTDNLARDVTYKGSPVTVSLYEESYLEELIEYDATVHGYRRERAVELNSMEEDSVTAVAHITENDSRKPLICGYGTFRGNVQPTALAGPVYADSSPIAEALYGLLMSSFPRAQERGLTLAAQSNNAQSCAVAEKLGLTRQVEIPRCFTRQDVSAEYSKLYAHHNLNFSTF